MSDLPELPSSYAESAVFISAAERGAPIVDDSDFAADLDPAHADAEADPSPAPPPRPRGVFGAGRGKRGG